MYGKIDPMSVLIKPLTKNAKYIVYIKGTWSASTRNLLDKDIIE
jgi:hypothetical protein